MILPKIVFSINKICFSLTFKSFFHLAPLSYSQIFCKLSTAKSLLHYKMDACCNYKLTKTYFINILIQVIRKIFWKFLRKHFWNCIKWIKLKQVILSRLKRIYWLILKISFGGSILQKDWNKFKMTKIQITISLFTSTIFSINKKIRTTLHW